MHLVYLDESGNAGNNLAHSQQPVFILCALLVPDDRWAKIESELFNAIEQVYPQPRPDDFELHANELINPRGFFRSSSIKTRLALYESCLNVARQHGLRVIYRSIIKRR